MGDSADALHERKGEADASEASRSCADGPALNVIDCEIVLFQKSFQSREEIAVA